MSGDDAETLSELFDRGFALHNKMENSDEDAAAEGFQAEARKAVLILEDATRMVSALDLFSKNETVGEVPTEHLKYFLLPGLLGKAHARLREDPSRRAEVIAVQEAYFRDFLQRCSDYEVCEVRLPPPDEGEEEGGDGPAPAARVPDLAKMNAEREEKLRRFRRNRELRERLAELEKVVAAKAADEEQAREFHLKTVEGLVYSCTEDLASLAMEKPILRHMAKVRRGAAPDPKAGGPASRPLRPVIITKDKAQKEVFGLGYKNVPLFSVEEFYEQRVRDGWFPDPEQARRQRQSSLMGNVGADTRAQEEEESRAREEAEERDDPEELARKRRWDEYRDTNRRGDGNRHNKG